MVNTLLLLAGFVAAGLLVRIVGGKERAQRLRKLLTDLVYWVLLPALTLRILWQAELTPQLWLVPILAVSTVGICVATAWLVYRSTDLPDPTKGALIIGASWGNVIYLGLPLVTALIGSSVSHIPLVYDMLGHTPLLFTLGAALGLRYGMKESGGRSRKGLLSVIASPPMIAMACGLVMNTHVPMPIAVNTVLEMCGLGVAPLMLFSIGLALGPLHWQSISRSVPAAFIKLGLSPAIGSVLVWFMISDKHIASAVRLETAMPTMVLPLVVAEQYGLDSNALSELIVLTTMAFAVVLTILIALP